MATRKIVMKIGDPVQLRGGGQTMTLTRCVPKPQYGDLGERWETVWLNAAGDLKTATLPAESLVLQTPEGNFKPVIAEVYEPEGGDQRMAFLTGLEDGLESTEQHGGEIGCGMSYDDLEQQDAWDYGANMGQSIGRALSKGRVDQLLYGIRCEIANFGN